MSMTVILGTLLAGILLIIAETFVPGGVIGAVGLVLVLIGIVAGFLRGADVGLVLLVGSLVVGIVLFYAWVKFFPKSRFGKRLILHQDAKTWQGYDDDNAGLYGKAGRTHSALHPTGIAVIEGKRIDVITRGEMLPPDRPVRVIEVEGNRVVVAEISAVEKPAV